MLIKLPEVMKEYKNLTLPHRGIVVDNADPKMIGRIKVKIPQVLETDDNAKLPWCYPLSPHQLGGRIDLSEFAVPEMKSEVTIVFPYNDPYFPFYTGYWQTGDNTHQNTVFDENYPESYGKIDSTVSWWKVNKDKKYTEHYHVSRHTARVDNLGDGYYYFPGFVDLVIDGNFNIKILGNLRLHVLQDVIFQFDMNWVNNILMNVDYNIGQNWINKILQSLDFDVAVKTLLNSGDDIALKTGKSFGVTAGSMAGLKSGADMGFVAGGNLCSNSPNIQHNGPVVDIDASVVNPDMSGDHQGTHQTNHVATHQANLIAQIVDLESHWTQLMTKVAELTVIAQITKAIAASVAGKLQAEAEQLLGRPQGGGGGGGGGGGAPSYSGTSGGAMGVLSPDTGAGNVSGGLG